MPLEYGPRLCISYLCRCLSAGGIPGVRFVLRRSLWNLPLVVRLSTLMFRAESILWKYS